MSYATRVSYVATEGQVEFDVTFPYLDPSHVFAFVGTVPLAYTWVSSTRLRLYDPRVAGEVVTLRRITPIDRALVVFQPGAILTAEEQNEAVLQCLYVQQELADLYTSSLDRAKIRVGENLGIITDPDAVMDEMVQMVLADDLLAELKQRYVDIDLNAQSIIDQANRLVDTQRQVDDHQAALDILNGTGDGSVVAIVHKETQSLSDSVSALGQSLDFIGALTPDGLAFRLATSTVEIDDGVSLASWRSSMEASDAANLALIQQEQNDRITAVSAEADARLTLKTQVDDNWSAFSSFQQSQTDQNSAFTQNIDALSGRVGSVESAITTEQTVRDQADQAEASARLQLATKVDDNWSAYESFVQSQTTQNNTFTEWFALLGAANAGGTSWMLDDQKVQVKAADGVTTLALATRLQGLDSRIGNNEAAVVNEQSARISGDQANATQIQTVQTTVDGHTSSITSIQQSLNGVMAKAGLELDVNGHITGWLANNNGSRGNFYVIADVFAVVDPNNGQAFVPFEVSGGVVRAPNLWVQNLVAGSVTTNAIVDGGVTTPKLTNSAITRHWTDDRSTSTIIPTAEGGSYDASQDVSVDGTGPVQVDVRLDIQSGTQGWVACRLYRDTTLIDTFTFPVLGGNASVRQTVSSWVKDYPSAGNHTYHYKVFSPDAVSNRTLSQVGLAVTEYRK